MEVVDFKFFKYLAVYSLVLGAACAVVSLIPLFMPFFSLFFIPFFGSIPPLILLIKKDNFYSKENLTYAVLGGVSGFFLTVSYVLILIPFVSLFHLINKNYYDYGVQYLNFFLFILFFVMIALVYVVTNSVAALILGVIYKYFKEK